MQELLQRTVYGEVLALKVEVLGPRGVAIANRWMLGWPVEARKLIQSGAFLQKLMEQVNREVAVMAEATELGHLADHEILAMHDVPMHPPALGTAPTKA